MNKSDLTNRQVDTAEEAWREHVNTDPFRDIKVDGVFMTTGHVTAVKPLAGSFVNVTVKEDVLTVGLGEDLKFPKVGEVITVEGVIKDGRKLTRKWFPGTA